jgi:hypothetical protein
MRFSTNSYYIFDYQTDNQWLLNEVEANEIVKVMNNLDIKAKERSKGMSTLQLKLNEMNLELYEQQKLCKALQEELENYKQLLARVNLELQEITGLLQNRERLVKLIASAESLSKDVSVREVLRDEIKGLDTVAEKSYNAFNDYIVLSTFYEKMYGESVWGDE